MSDDLSKELEQDDKMEAQQERREERVRARKEDAAEFDFERDCGAAE